MTRVYVLLDKRLTKSQRIPQAAHAVAQLYYERGGREMEAWAGFHRTLICLESDASSLKGTGDAEFFDEDLGFTTAAAFLPMEEEEGIRRFRHLRLA